MSKAKRSSMLGPALRYLELGWPVFPLRGKMPWISKEDGGRGCLDATVDESQVKAWWERWPKANIGVPTGIKFWALDIDTKTAGDISLEQLEAKHGRLPDTIQQITGTGGRHYLFELPSFELRNSTSEIAAGIDARGIGGYIVVAPSIHPETGREYVWDGMDRLDKQTILPAPEWILSLAKQKKSSSEKLVPGEKIQKGKQHTTLVSIAGTMRRRGMEFPEIFAALKVTNESRCTEPGPVENIRKIAESVCRYAPEKVSDGAAPKTRPPEQKNDAPQFKTPKQVITEAGGLEPYLESKHRRGLQTPWAQLNRLTGGFHAGELVMLAAGTGMGKTAMALNIAHGAACRGIPVAVFSLEMSEVEVTDRLMCISVGMDTQVLKRRVNNSQIEEAADRVAELPVYIMDQAVLGVKILREALDRLKEENPGIGLVVVDYLQLMSGGRRYENRTQEVSSMSRGLKIAAKEMELPFLVLSQLTRASGREKRRPELFDLRESGSIEQDANVVLFIHSEHEYRDAPSELISVELIIAKQRNGPHGVKLPLQFRLTCGRFEEAA